MSYLADGTYFVAPDIQAPLHDKRTVNAMTDFIGEEGFDGILCVGDEADCSPISRWSRGTKDEFSGTLEAGLTSAYDVLRDLSDALGDKPFHVVRSNHTNTRLQNYLGQYAPALAEVSFLKYDRLMGLNGHAPLLKNREDPLPITWHARPWEFAKGWVLAHGDEGNLSRVPGSTALSLAKRLGKSVVCGHTHRAGIQHHNVGVDGKLSNSLIGVEAGHWMEIGKASYLKSGYADWQQAWVSLHISRGRVYPEVHLIRSKAFAYRGSVWSW